MDILCFMKMYYMGLWIVYVDEIKEEKGNKYYFVFVKYDKVLKREVEIYRI